LLNDHIFGILVKKSDSMKPFFFTSRLIFLTIMILFFKQVYSQKSQSGQNKSDVLRFKNFSYTDRQGTGLEAFSFLMPVDWNFDGGITWILDNPAMPSVTAFRLSDVKSPDQFEVFSNHCYFWTTNLQLLGMFPPGSRYFGSTVKRVIPAQKALRDIIIPEQRKNLPGFRILKDENVPELPLALGAGKQAQGAGSSGATGAKLRIRYELNGIPLEEEFYAVVEQFSFPVKGMFGVFYNTIWYIDYIFSFRSAEGKLENSTKVFQTITSSFRVNPKWYAKYSNVIEYMAQQQITQIESVGEFSRMLSRMSDKISDEKMQQFKANSDVYDRVSEKFSDNTLGIDRYFDPHEGREVELPSGYNNAWCNNNGEYILTDNPNFNPNENSNLHWEPMKRK
jgi:hypothetical protein